MKKKGREKEQGVEEVAGPGVKAGSWRVGCGFWCGAWTTAAHATSTRSLPEGAASDLELHIFRHIWLASRHFTRSPYKSWKW